MKVMDDMLFFLDIFILYFCALDEGEAGHHKMQFEYTKRKTKKKNERSSCALRVP